MILGQDKLYQALNSTYPFVQQSIPHKSGIVFDATWLPQCVLYVRWDTRLPLRMSCLRSDNQSLIMQVQDAQGALVAKAVLVPGSSHYTSVLLRSPEMLPMGIITYDAAMPRALVPAINIIHAGVWHTPAQSFVFDASVLSAAADIGVQRITTQDNTPVQKLVLRDNIIFEAPSNRIHALSDIELNRGISVTGNSADAQCYTDKHIIIGHTTASDIRVAGDQDGLVIKGAVDA